MRKFLTAVLVCAALTPTAATANHEVPDPQPTITFAVERVHNNTPAHVGVWLHLDRALQTWRVDCDSPAPDPGPAGCPLVLDGVLAGDNHYGPLTDPGCSVPRGTGGEGRAELRPFVALGPGGITPADLRGVSFARTPVASAGTLPRSTALLLEGEWFDQYGRADRMEAVFTTLSSATAATDVCGTGDVAHLPLEGYVWLMGVVR